MAKVTMAVTCKGVSTTHTVQTAEELWEVLTDRALADDEVWIVTTDEDEDGTMYMRLRDKWADPAEGL